MRSMLDYLDCRRSRPPTPRPTPTAATAADHNHSTTAMDRAARERQQRLDDRERERKRREQLQQEEEDDDDSDVIELSPPATQPSHAARVVHTHQHEHHHHHHHTIALQQPTSKGVATRWMKDAGSRNGLHTAGGRKKRRRTQQTAWEEEEKEAGGEDDDDYVPNEKEEKAPQRKSRHSAATKPVRSRQSSILQHLTKQPRSPASNKQWPVKEENMEVDDEEDEEEEEEDEEEEEEEEGQDDDDDEAYVQESEEEEEEDEEEEEVKEMRPPAATMAHSVKGRASLRTPPVPRRNFIKHEDKEEVKEVKPATRPSSRRSSLSSDHKMKQEAATTPSSSTTSSSSSDFLSPFAPLPPPLPPLPSPPPFATNRLPASLAVRVGWRGDEGREADSWVERVRKVVYSSPSQIRIRYVLRAAATTQPAVLSSNRLSSAVLHAMSVFVAHLMVHASAAAFLQPVNPYALLIPDYFNIVHHPLSLSCISARLTAHYYSQPLQLLCDVRRVVECCWLYNECDSEVSDRARQLWGWVETVVRGELGGELGRASRELSRAKGVDVAMREWSERSVLQCVWFVLPRVDVHVAVSAEQLPRAVVRRLGRRMGRVPSEWSSEWLQHAIKP